MTARQYNFTKQNGVVMKASRRFTKQNGIVKKILAGWTKQNGVVEQVFETPGPDGIKFIPAPTGVTYTRPIYCRDDYIYCVGNGYTDETKINVETGAPVTISRDMPALSANAIVVFFYANGVAADQSILTPLGSYAADYIEFSINSDTCLSTALSGSGNGLVPLTRMSSALYYYFDAVSSSSETKLVVPDPLTVFTLSQPFNPAKCAPIGLADNIGYMFSLYGGNVYICSYETNQPVRYASRTVNVGSSFTFISGAYTPNGQDLFCSVYDGTNKVNKLIKFNTVSFDTNLFPLDTNIPQEKAFFGCYQNSLFFITPIVDGHNDITSLALEKYDLSGQKVSQETIEVPAGISIPYYEYFKKPTVTSTRYASVLLGNTLIWFDLSKL